MTDSRHPVVVGVDGLERTAGALAYAAREARAQGAVLRLVHVLPAYLPTPATLPVTPEDLREVGVRVLDRARHLVAEMQPEVRVETDLRVGWRPSEIVDGAADALLVVVGRAELRGPFQLWTGSTAAAVCARASSPVAVVPQDWRPDEDRHHRIVLGVRSGTDDGALLGPVFAHAEAHGATLVAVHAWHVPDPYVDLVEARTHEDDWVAEGTQTVERVLAPGRAGHPTVPVEIRVVHGRPAQVLHDAANDADLVVVLRRRHPLLPAGHLGGTARALVRTSPVPLLVVAPPLVPTTEGLVLEQSGEFLP